MDRYRHFFHRLKAPLIGIFIFLLVGIGFLASPLSPFHYCSLVGCVDSLEISFSHELPQSYTAVITSSTGGSRRIVCQTGAQQPAYPAAHCSSSSMTIYQFTPSDVSIEVSWQGGIFSSTGHPVYVKFKPNGPFCAPTCRSGELLLTIP